MNQPGALVLIVEDDAALRRVLRATLAAQGFRWVEATGVREALALAQSWNPDVVLLDLGLPDGDGIDVVRGLRTWSRAPILVLSARGREDEKVVLLDSGADDYVTKPFTTGELLARIRVALRHAAAPASIAPTVRCGDVTIDLEHHRVLRGGVEVKLTPTEFKLLAAMARVAGKVATHRQLLREVWGPAASGETHYVRVYMAQLRAKLEADPARPTLLKTEPGVGYRLEGTEAS
ncbi:MAG: response regulator [Planctomycetes bacterium]|nr:response regulator [Planctomycetota bacterium]